MDFHTQSDIQPSFRRIDEIFASKVFQPEADRNPLFQSALIELLIRIRDLMAKTKKYAKPVSFSDDIIVSDKVKDVSDAIKYVRDAVCHIDSDNHNHDEVNARLSFNTAFGKCNFMKIGDLELKSEYDDDVCFFFGSQKLYLYRHLERAYKEARVQLEPLLARA